jgi:hypothetical protein
MRGCAICAICAVLLYGCVSTKPRGDLGFRDAASLASFEGCYINEGETGKGAGTRFLSRAIWPKADIEHKNIEAVQVSSTEANTLRVTAFAAYQPIRQEFFVEGKDFVFESGKIRISHAIGSAATEPGNVFIGAGVTTTTLGIDAAGNGRSVDSATFAGTAFLVIPVAGNVSDTVRFRRTANLCGAK